MRRGIEQRGPYRVVDRATLHDRFNMALIHDKAENGDGNIHDYFWIDFEKDGVLVFALCENGDIVMINEFSYAINKTELGVPGGSVETGQTVIESGFMEAFEEAGLQLDPESVVYLGGVTSISNRINHTNHLLLTRVIGNGEQHLDGKFENISLMRLPFDEALEKAINGKITSASVGLGLCRIQYFFNALEGFFSAQVSLVQKLK